MLKCCYKLKVVNILSQSITASLSIQLIKTQATKSEGMKLGDKEDVGLNHYINIIDAGGNKNGEACVA